MDWDDFENELTFGEQTPIQALSSPYSSDWDPQYSGQSTSSSQSPCQSPQLHISQLSPPKTSRTSLSETPRPSSNRNCRDNEKPSSSQQREQQLEEPSTSRNQPPQILCDIPIVTPQSEGQYETPILYKRIVQLRKTIKHYNSKIEHCKTVETKTRYATRLGLAQVSKALVDFSNARSRAEKTRAEAKLARAQADKAKAEAEKAKAEGILTYEKMQAQTMEAFIKTLNALLPTVQKRMESLIEKDIE